ncbi:FUSC family protein [Ruficoccus amylovorans]|uniref:FUSC family protein n=1 Tax=Ruficoccus amylovorans TaxID=1804625 RepID=A0A842HDJ6_9BACT|nr:FUSC family protein [Ruficoccus amylovorans]MBC2593614.1 FUSC family protein [Ruficoccus amylovorans]
MAVLESIAASTGAVTGRWHWPKLNKLRWLTAFKASLASVIAIGIAMGLGWENPYWAGISVLVATLPYIGASLEKGIMRLIGTLFAGAVSYLICGAFPQNQFGYAAMLFGILVFTGYMGTGKFYPYAFFLSGITLSIINAQVFNNLDQLWPVVFFRVSEISLGVIVALTVNSLLWPQSASREMGRQMSTTLKDCIRLFDHSTASYSGYGEKLPDSGKLSEKLSGDFPKLRALLPQAMLDSSRFSNHRTSIQGALQFMESTFVSVVTTLHSTQGDFPRHYQENLSTELRAYTDALRAELCALANFFASPAPLPPAVAPDAHAALQTHLEALRASDTPLRYELSDTTAFMAYYANLAEIERVVMLLRKAAVAILQPGRERREVKERVRRNQARWRPDPMRLKHGIKVGVAVLGTLYLWQWTQCPGGVPGVITASILIQKTVVASNQKSMLRLGGCLLGGTAAAFFLLTVTPHLETFEELAPVLFLCFMVFTLINYGPARYSYAGFQAFLAFLLMTSVSNKQDISLEPGIERLLGILLGFMVCAIVLRLIWPVIPEHQLRSTLKTFFKDCRNYLDLYTPQVLRGEAPIAVVGSLETRLVDLPGACQEWVSQIGLHKSDEPQRGKYRQLSLCLQGFRFRLQALERAIRRPMAPVLAERMAPTLIELNQRLQETLDEFERTFENGQASTTYPDLDTPVSQLTHELTAMLRKEHLNRSIAAGDVAVFLALVRRYTDLTTEARNCREMIKALDLSIMERSPFF